MWRLRRFYLEHFTINICNLLTCFSFIPTDLQKILLFLISFESLFYFSFSPFSLSLETPWLPHYVILSFWHVDQILTGQNSKKMIFFQAKMANAFSIFFIAACVFNFRWEIFYQKQNALQRVFTLIVKTNLGLARLAW